MVLMTIQNDNNILNIYLDSKNNNS